MTGARVTNPGVSGGGAPVAADSVAGQLVANQLVTGQETMPRDITDSTGAQTGNQSLRLTYFTARKSETTSSVRLTSGATAAAATPTLVRFGLYLIAANGDGTLVASTANDTTLFAAATTAYTRSWSAPYALVAGQRYAQAVLVVTGVAAPTLSGTVVGSVAENAIAPRINGVISGQADLPASFTDASVIGSGTRHYAAILP